MANPDPSSGDTVLPPSADGVESPDVQTSTRESEAAPDPARTPEGGQWKAVLVGLIWWGVFSLAAPRIPGCRAFAERYVLGHPLELVSLALFFIGAAILLSRFRRIGSDRRMLRSAMEAVRDGQLPSAAASDARDQVSEYVASLSPEQRSTQPVRRIEDALRYADREGPAGLEGHLRYLAELAGVLLHQSYALVRTITWAIPILGFLGTVIGITLAIANVTPEQLESSLNEVTGGLAVAFDTTALALGLSIVLVMMTFTVERAEQRLLNDVERFGIDRIAGWFTVRGSGNEGDFVSAADEQMRTAWLQSFTAVQESWQQAVSLQTQQFAERLAKDSETLLAGRQEQAQQACDAYADVLAQAAGLLTEKWQSTVEAFDHRVASWEGALLESSQQSAAQSEQLHDLGRILLQLTQAEERLAETQKLVHDALQSADVIDSLQQTSAGLTAAINVLTARTSGQSRSRAA